jgi:hypothetical protein
MKMVDWVVKLDQFLEFNEYDALRHSGRIQASVAKKLAEQQYEKFRPIQDREYKSDFDRAVEGMKTTGRLPETEPMQTISEKPISDYDKKLKQALDYNPNEKK